MLNGVDIKESQISDFNESLDKFYTKYEEYLSKMQHYEELQRRTHQMKILAFNDGSCPAEDVDIFMHFPDGFVLSEEDPLRELPKEPEPPSPPQSFSEMLADLTRPRFYMPNLDYGPKTLPVAGPSNVGRLSIRRTKSYDVSVHIERLKHGLQELLDSAYLTFNSIDDAHSFTITYSVHCANMPEPVRGELHVKVEHL